MDTLNSMDAGVRRDGSDAEPSMDPPPAIGKDERRMHVRAYNYWASLLQGRVFPAIDDLNPETIGDFGPHGVLLDFSAGNHDPAIPWLGRALAEEGRHDNAITRLRDVPDGSLLSRLSDHYSDVVANRAPIGFEAEFDNVHGNHTLYRGILMPFSSDGATIDYIYGVINWKEVADAALVAGIAAEVASTTTPPKRPVAAAPAWADGPSRQTSGVISDPDGGTDLLKAAVDGADLARSTGSRAQTALYRALGLAYDLAIAEEATGAEPANDRTSRIAAIVARVFGSHATIRERADYCAVLAFGMRTGVGAGALRMVLEQYPGGLRAMARAERHARRSGLAN
ncbi:hypothetical protein [Sphingomonas montana]|uniref:hypothetical protein n=1 Tax=Sphingomonas montana TaxID=1843236 RepID=UPI00096C8392|nr:hypothetical protein [Sphingomonas montana]